MNNKPITEAIDNAALPFDVESPDLEQIIKLVGDNTLQVLARPEFQTLQIGQTNVIPPVTLYQGDMDGNNVLDINDYNLALPCFQDKLCPNANLIDFNDDGRADVRDYNLMLQSFETLHGN